MNYFNRFAIKIKFDILNFFMIIVTLKVFEYHQINVNNTFAEFFFKKKLHKIIVKRKYCIKKTLFIK